MAERYCCVHLNAGNCPFYPSARNGGTEEQVRKSFSTSVVYFEKDPATRLKEKPMGKSSVGCAVLDRYNLASEGDRGCMHLDTFITSQLSLEVMSNILKDIEIQNS